MLSKQISPNPAINADRYVVCDLLVSPESVTIKWHIEYRNSNWEIVPDTVKKIFSFCTDGNMVDMNTWSPAEMIHVPILDGEWNPTGETNPERPATAIPEHTFLKNVPANMFPDTSLRWRIERLVSMRIDRLDQQGDFNS